jgi:RNA-directed DNA polymerase
MKRYGNLKKLWCNYDSLLKAFQEVKQGKSFQYTILKYEDNLTVNLHNLLARLESETYEPHPTRDFYIHEPKKRFIQAPHIEDRIVQHALMNVIRPIIENRFIYDTYACRRDKGTHRASDRLKKFLIPYKNKGYYLKVDIHKFFYSINHQVIIRQLERIIKCRSTLDLLIKFFVNESGKGLPLGSVTSQLLANLALSPVDHYVKRVLKIKHYVRYMDDFVLLSHSKTQLQWCKVKVNRLVNELGMQTNSKTKIGKLKEGIDFVGYRTWYNNRLIRKRSLFAIRRKLKKNFSVNRMSSYLAHSKNTNSLKYVVSQVLLAAPEQAGFVESWLKRNLNLTEA